MLQSIIESFSGVNKRALATERDGATHEIAR